MIRSKEIRNVAVVGIVGNVFLFSIKMIVGVMSQSQAMLADGLNSAGDIFASLMTFFGNSIASRPDDDDHPYGHGKAEYLFSMIISFSLLLVAFSVFKSSFLSLINRQTFIFSVWLVVVSITTIVLKAIFYLYANRIGKKHNSLLAFSNAEDHRNDVFVTLLTLLSVITAQFELYFIDAFAGMLIALWIAYTGFTIFSSSYNVLMDTTIDESIKEKMKEEIEKIEGIDHLDTIVSKPVGVNYLLIVKLSLDGQFSIERGHAIGNQVKHLLMSYELVDDVVVHLNPAQSHPQKDYLR